MNGMARDVTVYFALPTAVVYGIGLVVLYVTVDPVLNGHVLSAGFVAALVGFGVLLYRLETTDTEGK